MPQEHDVRVNHGCKEIPLDIPVIPDDFPDRHKLQAGSMKNRHCREYTLLLNSIGHPQASILAFCNFYMARDAETGALVISCSSCQSAWKSEDLSLLNQVISPEDARARLHRCFPAPGPHPPNNDLNNFTFEMQRLISLLRNQNEFPENGQRTKLIFCLELAENGLYSLEQGVDTVHCFSCNVEISEWDPEDIIRNEHKEAATDDDGCHCPLLNGEYTANNPISLRVDNLQADAAAIDSAVLKEYEHFQEQSKRLESFGQWPNGNALNLEELANNFLVCLGGPKLMCCKCGLAFEVCGPNPNPLEYHKENRPDCS